MLPSVKSTQVIQRKEHIMAKEKLTARAAIAKVLGTKTMAVPEIVKAAVPLTNLGGKTPGQTIYSVLYSEAKKAGSARQFIQAGKGQFKVNPNFKAPARGSSGSKTKAASKKTTAAKSKAAPARKTGASRKRSSARKTTQAAK